MKKEMVVICCLLSSFASQAKTLNPADFNECIYSYWGARLKGSLTDARAAYDTAKAALYPTVTGNIATQNDLLADPKTHFSTGAYANLSQQLINISKWADIHSKKISEKATQLDFEDQLLTLMKTATKTYFEYIQSDKRLKLLQKRVARLEKGVALAKETRRLRLTDSSSVYLAQADKVQLDISITKAQAESSASLNTLGATIGISNGSLELDDSYNPDVNRDLSYWSKKIDELPAIQALKAKAEASGAAATSARDQIFPTLALSVDYGQPPQTVGISSGADPSLITTFTLSLPIFDQGIRSIQTQQAESQKSINEAQLSSKRTELLAEVKNILSQFEADEKISSLAKEELDNAQQGYDSLLTLFSFGKTSFVAIKNAEVSLVEAEIQLEGIQKKMAGEKTILELLSKYVSGRHQQPAGSGICSTDTVKR